jgi:hypothetical protein
LRINFNKKWPWLHLGRIVWRTHLVALIRVLSVYISFRARRISWHSKRIGCGIPLSKFKHVLHTLPMYLPMYLCTYVS